ncbi:MAG TPA: DnaJ domain-containing protein [Pseudonocardiaceae bacterium]|nr:DnaJ domain-containing protein [Pseudonocardiaceae bacterium]
MTPPEKRDLYAILGVAPDASPAQISRAYRRLLRAHPPAIDPDCDSAALTAAAILRDPARRAAYDRSRRRPAHRSNTPIASPPPPHRGRPPRRPSPLAPPLTTLHRSTADRLQDDDQAASPLRKSGVTTWTDDTSLSGL